MSAAPRVEVRWPERITGNDAGVADLETGIIRAFGTIGPRTPLDDVATAFELIVTANADPFAESPLASALRAHMIGNGA